MTSHAHLVSPLLREWARVSIGQIGRTLGSAKPAARARRAAVVQLDGVPRALIDESIASGRMPFLGSLVRSGAYRLDAAFWGTPASTPCFQAAALYGLRHPNVPAYHWYDRELGRVVHMNVPKDTVAIESRLEGQACGGSLLGGGGTAYLSLFRAGASNELCMSSLANTRLLLAALRRDLKGLSGVHRPRGFFGLVRELVRETASAALDIARWCYRLGDTRHERGFLVNQLLMMSLGWRLAHTRALIDMVRGVPNLYLVFGNFDEVAHRRGPWSPQARAELYRVDADLAELYAVAKTLDAPYDLIFLTDHGHCSAVPFEQLAGCELPTYLARPGERLPDELERGLLDGRTRPLPRKGDAPVVIDAGDYANVYLTSGRAPLEAREILAGHASLVSRAVASPEIGVVALRRGTGAVALVKGQAYGPDELDRAPLPAALSHDAVRDMLQEMPHMPTAGDLVLYGEVKDAGAVAFSWEFGSHGGLTRAETDSVVCWPTDAPVDLASLRHATQLHGRLSEVYRGS